MSLLTFPISISLLLSDILPHLRHNAGIKCVCLVFGLDKMSQTLTNICHRIIVVVAAVVAVAVAARVVTQKLPIIFQLANFVSSSADLNLFLFFCFNFFYFFLFFLFLTNFIFRLLAFLSGTINGSEKDPLCSIQNFTSILFQKKKKKKKKEKKKLRVCTSYNNLFRKGNQEQLEVEVAI
ncbi:predicted protein [Lodderomyces elongisporus NRRL YB-4239]|uniref:Uncharacterized protein n=1 Tax=Lodderomyces elongisporus (strain ATCC 11503 / CBS 2605 / JCM 1781 / NBRC 1676 / NRRL YB-4239) TaxID=379508 RepID=A5DRU4_LODEL|nr:predicted protein [Lodderomyces elongisporus NRRL YB-4239]